MQARQRISSLDANDLAETLLWGQALGASAATEVGCVAGVTRANVQTLLMSGQKDRLLRETESGEAVDSSKFLRKHTFGMQENKMMVQIVALLCVFGLGTCFSLLGSISVKLMPRLEIDQGKFGALVSAFMFSCLVASMIVGIVIDMVGYKPVAVAGFMLVGIMHLLDRPQPKLRCVLAACVCWASAPSP